MMANFSTVLLFCMVAGALAKYKITETKPKLEASEFPENITNTKTFQEFVRLVDKHNLNVSVIISSGVNYDDDNLKKVTTMTITMPSNEEGIKKPTLDKETIEKFAKIATEEKLTAAGSKAVDNHMDVLTNHREGLPINRAYKIFTGIKNGKTGFVLDEKAYLALHTFIVKGADGKNQTTQVYNSVFDVEVVKKSDNLKDEDLKLIKQAMVNGGATFDDELIPRGIVTSLEVAFPGKKWNAAYDVGENNYVPSDTWVLVRMLDTNYLAYTC